MAAGVVFNLGFFSWSQLGDVALEGMSLAFPVGLGLAVVVAMLLDYIIKPHVNAVLLFAAIAPVLAAVVLDVVAYPPPSLLQRAQEAIKSGRTRSTRLTASWKGIVLATIGGVLVALCSPLVDLSRAPETRTGPYAAAFMFAGGVFASTFVYNLFFMNLPVQGEPVELLHYFRQPKKPPASSVGRHVVGGGERFPLRGNQRRNRRSRRGSRAGTAARSRYRPRCGSGGRRAERLVGSAVWKEFRGAPDRARVPSR